MYNIKVIKQKAHYNGIHAAISLCLQLLQSQSRQVFVSPIKLSACLWKLITESALSPLYLLLHRCNEADQNTKQMLQES